MKYVISFFLFFLLANTFGQNLQEGVLFTIDSQPVYSSEFKRVFNKNLDLVKDESQKDVDEYLKLFINYKLKLREAYELGFDKKSSYVRELENYKNQLASGYMTDSHVTDELVTQAYDRTVNEVKASHILIRLPEAASSEDTLKAYNDLMKLRDRVANEGFEAVKKEVHNGQTIYAEELGWFSAFKMVYEFENAAYNTAVGEISKPFKTRFGYHIVNVEDKRKSRGERTVAHIMISSEKNDTVQGSSEERIREIYQKLMQGDDFEALAKQFSDDKSSAKNGGLLPAFKGGELSSQEFENMAFSLKNEGDISEPFKTQFGWHIIKLFNIRPVESFEVLKPDLEAKVKKDSRSQLINQTLVNTLKKEYGIQPNKSAMDYFVSILNDNYFRASWSLPDDFPASRPLVKIKDEQITFGQFADYLMRGQRRGIAKKDFRILVQESYEDFIGTRLIDYKKNHLEEENEDYANIVSEYRDGLLLFDLMENNIWNVSKTDTLDLKKYYNDHQDLYFWNKRVDAVVASSSDKSMIKKAEKLLKKGKTPQEIKESLNKEGQVNVIFSTGLMEEGHQSLPGDFKLEKGISKIYDYNEGYIVADVKEVLPKEQKSFEEARGMVISDYQNQKETLWLDELAKKYKITINQAELEKVKAELNK